MYLEHFGIKQYPFGLTPNTEFYCNLAEYEQALNVLLYGLKSNEGFIKVTGEVGTGKTLLCRKLLHLLTDPFVTAYIPAPDITPNELRIMLAKELGIDTDQLQANNQALDHTSLREQITERLLALKAQDKQVVLIIDEAQALPDDSLEAMRLLTNLETESERLLQIVLFAQPELDQRLAQHQFRQLQQRITFHYKLNCLSSEEVKSYIFHRLAIAGYSSGNLFKKSALKLVVKHCKGTPRLINIFCNKAMLIAYGKGDKKIDKKAMKYVLADCYHNYLAGHHSRIKKFLLSFAGVSLILFIGYAAYLHYIGQI